MADFELNEQQKEFLNASNCNLLVSASAGSGKTSTMIQKLIKILSTENCPINSLLVVTYTNAAASEIKLRLYNELTKLISHTDDVDKKSMLKKQLDNIGNAEIGTLHAICKKLIVKYFYELGETPDFALISDKEQKYLLDMSISNVFSKHIKEDDNDFFELYDCYNSNRSDMHLKKMVEQLYNFKVAKTGYNEWKKEFVGSSYTNELDKNIACNYVLEYYQKLIMFLSSSIIKLKNIAENSDFTRYFDFINTRYQFINEFSVAPEFSTATKILFSYIFPSKPRITEKSPVDERVFDEEVTQFNNSFGSLIKKIKEDFVSDDLDEIQKNIVNAKKNVIKLMAIVDEIEDNYTKIKVKKNVLDFNDLEDKMLKLLENEKIRDFLKNQYKYIFVDEYQDINDKQESILMSLVSDNNYYMIGDVKQSIYAFRQSSPKIFIDKYNRYSQKSESGLVVKFNINYRSDRNILEFANRVFDNIITRSTIGIDYKSDARFESIKKFSGSNVFLNIINDEDSDSEDKDELEAILIAEEIVRLVSTPRPDGSNYNYSDIAVILRQRGAFVKKLCDTLTKYQIPVKASLNSDFFGTSEINFMISILKVVSNYKDDVPLAVVLKNLFNVSEEELMCIRAYDENSEFYNNVKNYNVSDAVSEKIGKCFDFIAESKNILSFTTIKDYLIEVLDRFDILLKLKTQKNGIEKVNNILEFVRIADNSSYQYSLDRFLDYLEIISKDSTLKSIGNQNNAVEISTIHHSKGLEYPIVILGRLGKKFQLNKDSGNIIINSKFGIGLKSIDNINRTLSETIIRSACKIDNKKSELDEEIRLLYVAMTRAKEKLSLVGISNIDNLISNRDKQIYSLSTPLDMIFRCFTSFDINNFSNKKEFAVFGGLESEIKVKIYDNTDLKDEEVNEIKPIVLSDISEELKIGLLNAIGFVPDSNTTTIKNTVTNILKEETDYENLNFMPKKLDASDKVPDKNVLSLGTAYHSIMQNVKFNENYIELEGIIDNLVSSGKIDKNLKSSIKIEEILRAISVIKDLTEGATEVYQEKQFLLCEKYNKLIKTTDNNTKVIVQGVIDLVIVRGDEVYLIDYKTNRGVSDTQLTDLYRLQLELYSRAFEEATGKSVSHKCIYSFCLGKLIEVE